MKSKQERIRTLKKLQTDTTGKSSYHFLFKGQTTDFCIHRVSVDLPIYRLKNGRTISKQQEFIKINNKDSRFFEDNESPEAQEEQRKILKDMINEKDLKKDIKASMQQEEPVILDYQGVIINGNRRVCAIREEKIEKFDYIDCVILPESTDEETIDVLENTLQIKRDTKSPYSWIDIAIRINQRKNNKTIDEGKRTYEAIAQYCRMEEDKVKEYDYMYVLAKEYLKRIDKENEWSEIQKAEQIFKEFVDYREKIEGYDDKIFFTNLVFHTVKNSAKGKGRKYDTIANIKKYLPDIKNEVRSLNIDNFNDENSKQVIALVDQAIENKKDDEKDKQSLTLLDEAKSKIKKSREKFKRLDKIELKKKLEEIEKEIKQFHEYLNR